MVVESGEGWVALDYCVGRSKQDSLIGLDDHAEVVKGIADGADLEAGFLERRYRHSLAFLPAQTISGNAPALFDDEVVAEHGGESELGFYRLPVFLEGV